MTPQQSIEKRQGKVQARRFDCAYCGYSTYVLVIRKNGSMCCLDCDEFLRTGVDPRPFCDSCGRSIPEGEVCGCGGGAR